MSKQPLSRLFHPRAIGVYGASADPKKIGGRPVDFIKRSGFEGPLYPINPNYPEIQGLKAYPRATAIEGPLDLVIVAVPAPGVVAALEDCAAKGVGGCVVLSSGFAEAGGAQGEAWQAQIVELSRRTGMRVVGPNCMGIINVRRGILGTFTPSAEGSGLKPGRISLVSQSGAFGGFCLALMRQNGIGLNLWITTGNQSDVDFADCVRYYADDADTSVIVGYIEGITDRDRLIDALAYARSKEKPVVVMKVGSSDAGAAAAASHTASLAGADQVYDGLFRQYGVYRAHSIDEFFDVAYACATASAKPKSDRLGIVTVSGGVGVLMADVAAKVGLDVAPMPEDAQRQLKEYLPFAGTRNPVDMTAQLVNDLSLFEKNFEMLLARGNYDTVVSFLSSVGLDKNLNQEIIGQLRKVLANYPGRLVIMSMLSNQEVRRMYEQEGLLVFDEPTRAVRAAAALRHFARELERAKTLDAPPSLPAGVRKVERGALNETQAKEILMSAGIPMTREVVAKTADEAARQANEIGFPVVLKIASPDIQHKSDIGGVLLKLADAEAVRAGFHTIMQRVRKAEPNARIDGVVVAQMITGGVETILGVNRDPVFGPVVMFGIGGVFVEAFKDVAFRVAPFGEAEARAMIDEVKGRVMLRGLRGAPPADEAALVRALAQLSSFAAANADVIETIDINPFVVLPAGQGAVALDALIVTRD
ncbi:MAG TPA: acetate--CoA ligase family protein [Rhodocyclaceae bacterium]|nr:acetate--CoA ligase family protein [Rhodocyclaceae bacterium]